jgi:hypothetical protein
VPGPWLRLTALAAAGGALLAVVSGAADLGTAHKLLAALAVPPLVALVLAAWFAHRPLLPVTLGLLSSASRPSSRRRGSTWRSPGSPSRPRWWLRQSYTATDGSRSALSATT